MNLGGLAAKLAQLKQQKPTRPCPRCGQHYVMEDHERCPHCGTLTDRQVQQLLASLEQQQVAHQHLGAKFLVATLLLVFLLWLVANP